MNTDVVASLLRRAVALALALGAVARLAQYLAATSLWHDEAFVALIVRQTPFAELLGSLDWDEPVPPGFLVAEQLVVALAGTSELSLRLLPLLAALAALWAAAVLAARACGSAAGAFFATLLFAASDLLIAQAALVKHFSCDALFATALVGIAWCAWRRPRAATLLAWGAVGAVGLWFSYASAFVIAGSGAVLLAAALCRWSGAARAALAVAGVAIALSAALLLPAVLAQRGAAVVELWAGHFPPRAGAAAQALWLGRALIGVFDHLWRPLGGLLIVPALLAAAAAWRDERRPLLLMLGLPLGVALGASLFGWWPFGGNQHIAFAAPAVLLLAGDGLERLRRHLAPRRAALAWAMVVLVLAPGVLEAVWHLAAPRRRHEMRDAIAFMQARARPDDALAVFDPATFAFYTGRDLRGVPPDLYAAPRVWVLTPSSSRGELHPDIAAVVRHLADTRPRLAAHAPFGARAYLFGPAGTPP